MFAGPNGSGKSTLKSVLPARLLGTYLNPDDIEREIREAGSLNLATFGVTATGIEVEQFFSGSELMRVRETGGRRDFPVLAGTLLRFPFAAVDSYLGSATVDLLRRRLLAAGSSFTFETVMSHPGKVELLAEAQAMGYRTDMGFAGSKTRNTRHEADLRPPDPQKLTCRPWRNRLPKSASPSVPPRSG